MPQHQSLEREVQAAVDDPRARLLALEIVTVAALNRLLRDAPDLQAAMDELGNPGKLPERPGAGDSVFMEHVQANVMRLASGINAKL